MICHKLSHFNSQVFILDFTWNCCRLQATTKFSRNSGQFKCVTRGTRYHVSIAELLMRNLWSQVAELVQRSRTMLEILYFSGGHQIFQTSPGVKCLYGRGRKLIYWLGRHNLGPGRQFQQINQPGKPLGLIAPGHLDRVFSAVLHPPLSIDSVVHQNAAFIRSLITM